MSIHSSLRGADNLTGERSVLTRMERMVLLAKEGRFDGENDSAWGLPKTRTKFKSTVVKKKKEKKEDEKAAE